MLIVSAPDSFISERVYIIKAILGNYLGTDFIIKVHTDRDYRIDVDGSNFLIIKDNFFSTIDEKTGYLKEEYIPKSIDLLLNEFTGYQNVPIIFGKNLVTNDNNKIILWADIFASAYFALTRWEEFVVNKHDAHNRFISTESLAYKWNYIQSPVVDQYGELLWNLLLKLNFKGIRKTRVFKITPTHDIDQISYWNKVNRKAILRNLTGDILKRKNPALALSRLGSYMGFLCLKYDPCNTFNYLMNKAEISGKTATFYFIAGGETEYERNYSIQCPSVQDLIRKIINRGHSIGVHISYNSYNNSIKLKNEKCDLSSVTEHDVDESRNHYLRFEIPGTFNLLEEACIKVESSMYYPDLPGFRCGTCHEFPVFDFISRKELELIERPLIVMDTSFRNEKPEKVYSQITSLKETVKKFKGNFVFLWHNSNIDTPEWKPLKKTFEKTFYGD
jgi:hypothetical protein